MKMRVSSYEPQNEAFKDDVFPSDFFEIIIIFFSRLNVLNHRISAVESLKLKCTKRSQIHIFPFKQSLLDSGIYIGSPGTSF